MFNVMKYLRERKVEGLETKINHLTSENDVLRSNVETNFADRIAVSDYWTSENQKITKNFRNVINKLEDKITENDLTIKGMCANHEGNLIEVYRQNLQETKKVEDKVRAESKTKIETLEKSEEKASRELLDVKGRYEGTLIVIKNQEKQIAELVKLNGNLLSSLPSVKVSTGGDNNVTVNK